MSKIRKTRETRPLASHTVNDYSESESNAYSCDYSNKAFGGKILWTNDTPNAEISTKTINLSSSDYDLLEIIFKQTTTLNIINSTKTIKGADGRIGVWYATNGLTAYRNLSRVSDTQYTLEAVVGGITTNNYIIPLYIIGYNTGLFPTQQSNRSLNTYSGDIEEKKDIVIDDGEKEKPIDESNDENNK